MPSLRVFAQLEREWRAFETGLRVPPLGRPAELGARPLGKGALYAELEDVRRAWAELRASRRLAEDAARLITSQWTLRDLLAHLASWAREFRAEAETAARGERFDYEIPFAPGVGPTEWNHAQVAARQERTLEEIFDELDAETRLLQDRVLEVPAESLYAQADFPVIITGATPAPMLHSIAELALARCMHDHHHLARIRRWRPEQPDRDPR